MVWIISTIAFQFEPIIKNKKRVKVNINFINVSTWVNDVFS